MKLGICYMTFDGVELLEFALKNIRNNVDHIAVTYQTKSYFGNIANPEWKLILVNLQSSGLIDELIYYEPNLSWHHKKNELNLRNIGLNSSRNAGCTHHISADVDEFYDIVQLEYIKEIMDNENYDFSIVHLMNYYKDPTYLVWPIQHMLCSLIHPVSNEYSDTPNFPFKIEPTRRFVNSNKYKIFTKDEFIIHHMSYVRKDIKNKFQNSDNGLFIKVDKFIDNYDNYQLGEKVCLLPDFINRKTIQVENKFGIKL